MRTSCLPFVALGLTILGAFPAAAGTVTVTDGNVTAWQSTGCVEPPAPPALVKADRETQGENMNLLVSQYNDYAQLMEVYMNCISTESQNDAARTGEAIVQSARGQIDAARAKLDSLGAPLTKD
jgi:hypothetical protein